MAWARTISLSALKDCLRQILGVVAVVALPIALMPLIPAAQADPVAVSGNVDDGFGIITFRWPRPVPFTLSQEDRTVTVTFGRPVDSANFNAALATLNGYLEGARVAPAGNAIILTLKSNFEASGYDAAEAINIFFVGDPVGAKPPAAEPQQAEAPVQPAPPAQPTEAVAEAPLTQPGAEDSQQPPASAASQPISPSGPSIGIRTGLHDDYTRVVFDFTETVGYTFQNDNGVVRLAFEKPLQFDLARFNNTPPRLIGGARATYSPDGVSVVFAVPETSEVRDFLSGPKLVLDIRNPTGTETPVAMPAPDVVTPTEEPEPTQLAQVAPPDDNVAPPAEGQVAPEETDAPPPERPLADGANPQEDQAPAARDGEPAPEEAAAEQDPTAPISLAPPPEAEGVSGALGEYGKTPETLQNFAKDMAGNAQSRQAEEEAKLARRAQAVALRFDWPSPVGAAVFRRTGPLWVVFDKYIKVDTKGLKEAAGNAIRNIEQVSSSRATILRFDTLSGINPSLRRDGLAWILEFRKQDIFANQSIEVVAQPDSPVGPRIFVPVPEPGEPIVVIDPDVRDTVVVVPVIPLSHGVNHIFNYPNVRILKTAQGVVVKPWADDIRVRSLRQGIEISAPESLAISEVSPEIMANMMLEVVKPLTRIFDLDKWRRGGMNDYVENRSKLYLNVADAKTDGDRQQARLDLARFYFANRLAPEALGVLRVMLQKDPDLLNEPEVTMMRGAANLLMGRYVDAAKLLSHKVLDGNDEAIFWRSVLVAETGELPTAAEELRRTGSIIRPYPRALKVPLGLIVTEAAIHLGDPKTATHYLEILNVEDPTPSEKRSIEYLEGKLAETGGNFDEAITKWEEVIKGDNRWARARAAVAKVELLMKIQRLEPREAVEELETLRFAWRGDDFEFDLLRRMGDLYLSIGDYRNGLNTLRQAATHFREHEEAAEVTRQMAEAFQGLYLDGEADRLTPVTAIALYDEFKELTPAGGRGDQMIQMLAERLVDADLLDRASELLEAQVQFRLKDAEKARVGARLALIYVMARRYEDAINALDRTEFAGATQEIKDQRRLIQARALMGLKKEPEALVLLEQDESIDSYRLRNEIYWGAKDWRNASQSLREIVKLLDAKSRKPLNEEQMGVILRLGVAMILAGNERGVARLVEDFGPQMMQGPYAEGFQLIARGPERGLIDFRTIAGKVGSVQTFKTFLGSMKQRMRDENARAFN